MPFDFGSLKYDNPFMKNFMESMTFPQNYQKQSMQNQMTQQQLPFVTPELQQALLKSQIENKYLEPKLRAQIQSANAETAAKQFDLANPLLGKAGLAGQLGAEQYSKNQGLTEQANLIHKSIEQSLMADKVKNTSWNSMPANYRGAAIAQARAFGYDTAEAAQNLAQGATLSQLAAEKGLSSDQSSWPVPSAAPTTAMLTQQQRSNVAIAGINAIDKDLTDRLAPYSTRWDGYSLEQLKESLAGQDEQKIGEALGAAALQQELAILRQRAGGVQNIGIEMLRESLNASGNRLHVPQILQSPKVYKTAQDFIRKELVKLNKAENQALYNIPNAYSSSNNDDVSSMSDEDLLKISQGG